MLRGVSEHTLPSSLHWLSVAVGCAGWFCMSVRAPPWGRAARNRRIDRSSRHVFAFARMTAHLGPTIPDCKEHSHVASHAPSSYCTAGGFVRSSILGTFLDEATVSVTARMQCVAKSVSSRCHPESRQPMHCRVVRRRLSTSALPAGSSTSRTLCALHPSSVGQLKRRAAS